MKRASKRRSRATEHSTYQTFDQLDGEHPWRDHVPEGLILYPVRRLSGAKVSYFNFELAREMGLIAIDHPSALNPELNEKLLDTFALRIVNEYDQANGVRVRGIKPKKFMATRYLQLQHADKTGRTSGDGRCIWNGVFKGTDRTWDVSSRGTGVTALAPGAVLAGAPLKSGNRDFGYGCGLAEIDELFGAAILAEIFHRNEVPTERVLAIIDLGRGVGIGVRAAPNLIRPAHIFLYLKQGKREPLARAFDYLIARQTQNGTWSIASNDPARYKKALTELSVAFARFAAHLERDYIFAWLDWDGDNVLADAGIIDYGSVRQFGLRHDQYRYDDVERFSTNLNEQRLKAREMLQTFVQAVDYLETGRKRSRKAYRSAPALNVFDREFETHKLERLLFQVGFTKPLRRLLLNNHRPEVERFARVHQRFERTKTAARARKVADGIHRPAIFNMRTALAHMAEYLDGLPHDYNPHVEAKEFFGWILSTQSTRRDRKISRQRRGDITRWQANYLTLLRAVCSSVTWERTLKTLNVRARLINANHRLTGNALIHIVDEILRYRRRGLSDVEVQRAIDDLIAVQTLNPDLHVERPVTEGKPLLRAFLTVVHGFREDI